MVLDEEKKVLEVKEVVEEEPKKDPKKKDEPPPPPFAGLKLKKSKRVERKPLEEPKIEKVELKHHEFEKPPQTETVTIYTIHKL